MKKNLSERDICTKYITPAIEKGGWDLKRQVREEVSFTAGSLKKILNGFKESSLEKFPHTLFTRDVVIKEDRILKAISK